MKTIKEELKDAVALDMDKRALCRVCGNALAEINRLEDELAVALGMNALALDNKKPVT